MAIPETALRDEGACYTLRQTRFDDVIHSARFAYKAHTSSLSSFESSPGGPIGWVSEGTTVVAARPARHQPLSIPAGAPAAKVCVLKVFLGAEGDLVKAIANLKY